MSRYVACVFVCLAAVMSSAAEGAPITVTNHSFELQDVPNGSVGVPIGWTRVGSAFAFDPTTTALPNGTTDGDQTLFLQSSASASQTLAALLTAGTTYDLRVDVGSRADFNFITAYQVSLMAGATVLGTDTGPLPNPGEFLLAQVLYTALAGDPLLGQPLSIVLSAIGSVSSSTTLMDNVRLDATAAAAAQVPEPGTVVLLITGLAGAAVVRRRKA